MILGILSSKGGVGKSVTAQSLAAAWANEVLARKTKPVLLVDTDPQATITKFYEPPSHTLYELLQRQSSLEETLVEVRPGLFLLGGERELGTLNHQWLMLPQLLSHLSTRFSHIIVDTPAGWLPQAQQTALAADYLLVPVNSEIASHEQALETQSLVESVAPFGSEPKPLSFLLTMFRSSPSARTVAAFPGPWLETRIPRSEIVNKLAIKSQSVFDGNAKTVREAYYALAKELEAQASTQKRKKKTRK